MNSKWWIFLVTVAATALVFLDNTTMPVALPTIQAYFKLTDLDVSWVVNAYLLSLISLLLISGRMSDLFGRKTIFLIGLSLYLCGSIVGATSFSTFFLMLGRVIQGCGGALIVPTTVAILMATFPKHQHARALGFNFALSAVFLVVGPVVGGALTQYFSWRGVFIFNMPLAIFGLVMSGVLLKKSETLKEPFHLVGGGIAILSLVCIVVGVMQGRVWGWSSPLTLSLLIAGPILFAIFVWLSLHEKHPLVDFTIFHNRHFAGASICLFCTQVIIGVTVLWAIYFQEQLDYSPLQTGGIIFLATLPILIMAPLGGYLADRFNAQLPLTIGYALLLFSLSWLLFQTKATTIRPFMPGLIAFGFSIPMIMSPVVAMGMSLVSGNHLGSASGILTSTRQLASTLGIAMMTTIFYSAANYAKGFFAISITAVGLAAFGFVIILFMLRPNHVENL